ncbi:MAG: amidase [Comamonadaceae bacterium]|nr:MAG: amidase [Comamonadaceae bacterium]
MHPDVHTTRALIHEGLTSPSEEMEKCIETASSPGNAAVFLRTMFDDARTAAASPGAASGPLAGLAVSVKDLFDVQGQPTAAGSAVLAGARPAAVDCPAVARLKAAGGIVIGRTNMTEFAFSGMGINPHHGTPANAAVQGTPRIPGGSTSGGGVSVAAGSSFVGLGSDTGGSIRIPAALNGIVGFKSTARLVPAEGALPLSPTLDTVSALTRSVRDAALVHEILADRRVVRSGAPLSSYRLAVAQTAMLDGMDDTVSRAFARTLEAFRSAGARIDDIPLKEIGELGAINSTGGFSAAESYAWHRSLLGERGTAYDPRVAARIQRGAAMKSFEYLDLVKARREWIGRMTRAMQGYDAVLSPTVPLVAPPIAEVAPGEERDEEFFRVNALMLRNTSVVNMLDGCAISIPCHQDAELPVGLMIWQGPMRDDTVLNIALQAETLLQGPQA